MEWWTASPDDRHPNSEEPVKAEKASYEVASTTADSGSDVSPSKNFGGPMLDYQNLPRSIVVELERQSYDLDAVYAEIERAKSHPYFADFIVYFRKQYGLPDSHVWGAEPHDPWEDVEDFLKWLLISGLGHYATNSDPDHPPHLPGISDEPNEARMR